MELKHKSGLTPACSPLTAKPAELIESIHVDTIIELYKSNFNIDISSLCENYEEIGFYLCKDSGLKFFYPAITGDALFYGQLQKYSWYYQDEKHEWGFAKKYTKDKRLVEIGCGEGKFCAHAQSSEYVGLELNDSAVEIAVNNGIDVRNQLASDHGKERAGYYDIVCSFQVLEHVKDIHGFISDAINLCKHNGKIIFSVPNEDGFVGLASNNILNMPPHHVSRWTNKALKYLPHKYELELLQIHNDDFDMIHFEWYARILGGYILRKFFNRTVTPLLTTSIADRMIEKAGRSIGKKLVKGGDFINILPAGHSVTVMYEKK